MSVQPEDPELIDRLASEYVLGTLRGPARRRFERWRAGSPGVDARCRFWEERLMPLAKGLQPVQPPAYVWQAIRKRLNLSQTEPRQRWTRKLAMAASIVLVIALGALWYWRTVAPRATEVATISAPSGTALWKVEIYGQAGEPGRLVVHTETLPARPAGHDYELWALPKGGNPVSLGVLPTQGISRHTLSAVQQKALASSAQIAVSIEPSGGSPTGQPTGAVVFVAPLHPV